jgi:SAM-dependent methyltransferase
MNPHFGTPMTAEQYAAQWQENSTFFSTNGHYDWMRSFLGQPSTVIEIGCGSGGGTLALAQKAQRVVAVEVNTTLANAAAAYLNSNAVPTEVVNIEVQGNPLPPSNCRVTIVVSDVFDNLLSGVLSSVGADAMVCWLIGANPGLISTHLGKGLESFTGPEMPEYRERIHRRTYDLGVSLLKPGGMIHIADRMALNSWKDKDQARLTLVEHHISLSNGKYQISKEGSFLKRLEKSFATSKIQYIAPPEVNGSAISVLSSVTARKL